MLGKSQRAATMYSSMSHSRRIKIEKNSKVFLFGTVQATEESITPGYHRVSSSFLLLQHAKSRDLLVTVEEKEASYDDDDTWIGNNILSYCNSQQQTTLFCVFNQ